MPLLRIVIHAYRYAGSLGVTPSTRSGVSNVPTKASFVRSIHAVISVKRTNDIDPFQINVITIGGLDAV